MFTYYIPAWKRPLLTVYIHFLQSRFFNPLLLPVFHTVTGSCTAPSPCCLCRWSPPPAAGAQQLLANIASTPTLIQHCLAQKPTWAPQLCWAEHRWSTAFLEHGKDSSSAPLWYYRLCTASCHQAGQPRATKSSSTRVFLTHQNLSERGEVKGCLSTFFSRLLFWSEQYSLVPTVHPWDFKT